MKNRYIAYVILLFFLFEGTLLIWMLPAEWRTKYMLAPHLVFVVILYLSIFRHRHLGLLFGLIFGLMQDIVYESPMIGAHGFSMALIAYTAGAAAKRLKLSLTSTFLLVSASLVSYDLLVFSLYRLFRVTGIPYSVAITQHVTLSLLFNLLFAVLIYVPARKWLAAKVERRSEED